MTGNRISRAGVINGASTDRWMLPALASGFVDLIYHDLREFPVSVLWRSDTLILFAVTVGLVVGGGLIRFINDIAGAVTYDRDHHLSHWIYGATHLPLVWLAWTARRE